MAFVQLQEYSANKREKVNQILVHADLGFHLALHPFGVAELPEWI
jgi:hypothetical protein